VMSVSPTCLEIELLAKPRPTFKGTKIRYSPRTYILTIPYSLYPSGCISPRALKAVDAQEIYSQLHRT
jgi:hypothetical protein